MQPFTRDIEINMWIQSSMWTRHGQVRPSALSQSGGVLAEANSLLQNIASSMGDNSDLFGPQHTAIMFDGEYAKLVDPLPVDFSSLATYDLCNLTAGLAVGTTVGRLAVNHPILLGLVERPLLEDQFTDCIKQQLPAGNALLGTSEGTNVGWFSFNADHSEEGCLYVVPVFDEVTSNEDYTDAPDFYTVTWELRQVGVDMSLSYDPFRLDDVNRPRANWDDEEGCGQLFSTVFENDIQAMMVQRALTDPKHFASYQTCRGTRADQTEAWTLLASKATRAASKKKTEDLLFRFSWIGLLPPDDARHFAAPRAGSPLGVGGNKALPELRHLTRRNVAIPLLVAAPAMLQMNELKSWAERREEVISYFAPTFARHLASIDCTLIRVGSDSKLYAVGNVDMFYTVFPACFDDDINAGERAKAARDSMCLYDVGADVWVPVRG